MTTEWRDLPTMADVAAAQTAGDEIHFLGVGCTEWVAWDGAVWRDDWLFRARPPQPKMKKVKMLCFYNGKELFWAESGSGYPYRCRIPAEDKEIEVPDDN